ncbi:hypothetical protein ACFSCX_24010 [Bacillus salitolerans]|uniref:Uncharacterized protein n=1 Tax=Bacillus salitolerans TaxID=1437434 RepID=A0ABW4LXB7_9BACI
MSINYDGNQLFIYGKSLSFNDPIRSIKEYKNLVLVLLAVPSGKINNRNVYAINREDTDIYWQIEEPDLIYEDCPYTNFIENNNQIIIGNWNGITYLIDEKNGKRIGAIQTK